MGRSDKTVIIIGAGLAGAEAAWQIIQKGFRVRLFEMRPFRMTPAHNSDQFAELVCSNSLKSATLENAAGLLKEEMRLLNSLIINCADKNRVPAGNALAVDRELFSSCVTDRISKHPSVKVFRQEVASIPDGETVIIATGPLTSDALADSLRNLTGNDNLYFFDAVAPIIMTESINMSKVFQSSRYGKGEAAYINCPMSEEQYEMFWHALLKAEKAPRKEFDKEIFFEGCMPIEVLASRGRETLLYGPLKPVGLIDPRTGRRPFAVVQLRQENAIASMYNMVGFQTSLKWSEQRHVIRLIPGLEEAEFARYGVIHRNTYINSPALLNPSYQCSSIPSLFFAGQLTGVEGYIESSSSGLIAGLNACRFVQGKELLVFPEDTALGALARYIANGDPSRFKPMNINYGLFPPFKERVKDRRKRGELIAQRSLESLKNFMLNIN